MFVQVGDWRESAVRTDSRVGILTLLQRSRVEAVAEEGSMMLAWKTAFVVGRKMSLG